MAKNIVGLFDNQSDAQAAMRELQDAGFSGGNISLLRGASSQLAGTFDQLGIPGDDARIYQQGLHNGGALIILQQLADDDAATAAAILERHNLVDIDQRMQGFGATSAATASGTPALSSSARSTRQGTGTFGGSGRSFYQGGEAVIPIVEEELVVGKRAVESGGVRVSTRVEETPVNEQVTLRDEEIQVTRVPVDRPIDPATGSVDEAFMPVSFEMQERDEVAVVDKQARVVEEVVIEKDVAQRTETVQDTVRRTDVDVQEVSGQQRTPGYTRTTGGVTSTASGTTDEGAIERGASGLGNAVERGAGVDLDRDGDVGRRDPRNNI